MTFATLVAAHALAQQSGPVVSRLESSKVTRAADGKEALSPAQAVKPGDVIEYSAIYRNNGKAGVRELAATLPIPANTEFVAGSSRPAGALASLDGRNFAAPPLKRQVVRNGRTIEEEVPVREYRFLRWLSPELAGQSALTFTARVKVVDETGPPSKAATR